MPIREGPHNKRQVWGFFQKEGGNAFSLTQIMDYLSHFFSSFIIIYQSQSMPKIFFLILLFSFFSSFQPTVLDLNLGKNFQELSAQQVLPKIHNLNKREFWFYLRRPQVIFDDCKVTPTKYSFVIIYQSVAGVFLSVSIYNRRTEHINIECMIRLGSMIHEDSMDDGLISLDPYIIEIRMAEKEFTIKINENGELQMNPQIFEFRGSSQSVRDQKIMLTDRYVKHRFWHYIYDAEIIQTETVNYQESKYYLFLYESNSKVYLTVAGLNNTYQLDVTAFIRLGKKVEGKNERLISIQDLKIVAVK